MEMKDGMIAVAQHGGELHGKMNVGETRKVVNGGKLVKVDIWIGVDIYLGKVGGLVIFVFLLG